MFKSSVFVLRQINWNMSSLLHTRPRLNFYKSMATVSLRKSTKRSPYSYALLAVPGLTFGLGCWQIQRYFWKQNLKRTLEEKLSLPAVPFTPSLLDTKEKLDYIKVSVTGTYDHSKEMYIGPRSLLGKERSAAFGPNEVGYLVVTPFTLEETGQIILVNRGWIPKTEKRSGRRMEGQVEGVQSLTGYLRSHENRPPLMPKDSKQGNTFLYRDIKSMASASESDSVYIDAIESIPGGPIAGQTRIKLRDDHLSYLITWFTLSFATAYMWYNKFVKGSRVIIRP